MITRQLPDIRKYLNWISNPFFANIFILALIATAIYGRWLDSPIVFDDFNFFTSNYVSQYSSSFAPLTTRFWSYASFAHESLFFGHSYAEMRATNLAIHVLCAFLVGVFLAKLIGMSDRNNASKNAIYLSAAICSGLFLLHPISVYAVAYLIQRSILMATLFSLAMWISYLEAINTGKTRWLWISVVFFYLAVFSKSQASLSIVTPVLISYLFWNELRKNLSLVKISIALILYIAIFLISVYQFSYLLAKSYEPLLVYMPIHHETHHYSFVSEVYLRSILTQGEMFFRYIKLYLIPNPFEMSVDIRTGLIKDPSKLSNWIGITAYLVFGFVSMLMFMKRKIIGITGLGLLIVFSLFLVELSTVREQEVFVIYRSYLWMTGFMITTATCVYWLTKRIGAKIVILITLPVLIGFSWASDQRLSTFSSEKLLWSDAIRLFEKEKPETYNLAERAYYARGLALAKEKRYIDALVDINKSIALNPDYYLAYHAKGEIEFEQGNYGSALESFNKVLNIRKNYYPARISLARTLIKTGRESEGYSELQDVCSAGSSSACFYLHKLKTPDSEFVFTPPSNK